MQFSSLVIDFMSGTGNSYRAAVWMAELAERKGITSRLCQISKTPEESNQGEDLKGLLGVVFPTHGFTAPWQVIKHTWRLPRGRGKHVFVVATRAGTRFASIPFPGLEGTAGYLIALLLSIRGYNVRGVMGLDMPSNWMSLHWGLKLANSKFILERAKIKADSFLQSILERKSQFRGFLPLILGLILSPLSLAYLVLGRFFFAKLFFASEKCSGCGLCAKSCPNKAIRMAGSKKPRPYWTFSCESCMRCMGYCPVQAIESSHSFAILLYFIITLPVSWYGIDGLEGLDGISKIMPLGPYRFFVKILFDYVYSMNGSTGGTTYVLVTPIVG